MIMDLRADLTGKVALVTGSSTGIGRAVALALARSGASVGIHYAHSEGAAQGLAREIAAELGEGRVRVFQADLTRVSEGERLVDACAEAFGRLDILVNNAGGLFDRIFMEEMTESFWDQAFALNLKTPAFCCKRAIPIMRRQGWGRIINISSISARTGGTRGSAAYAAAKAGLSSLTRTLARELASTNITVNGVAPGVIDTPLHERYTPPERFQALVAGIPMKRAGQPEEVAGAVLFLASEASRYITGEIIEVNGGLLMN